MGSISINFSRSFDIAEKPDLGEKIADAGLGLLRMGMGHTVRVRHVELVDGSEDIFFEKKERSVLQRIAAIALAILILPVTLILTAIGCIGLAVSKSHERLYKSMNGKTPEQENQRIHDAIEEQIGDTEAENSVLELGEKQFIYFNAKTQKYVYVSEAPPIKNLVISGGGAKGVILLGVIQAFEEHKVGDISFRDQLENVAGSSVGALTAALFASGITAEELGTASQAEDFKKLLGEGWGPIYKDGKPLMNFLRKNMQQAIRDRLEKQFGDLSHVMEAVKTGSEDIQKVLDVLEIPFDEKGDNEDIQITFSMLRSLHQLDPHGFKDLTVTATCRETGQTIYFDADNHPDLDIAIACRASASLPIILAPVQIDDHTYSDGGYLDNVPVAPMENKQGEGPENKGEKRQNLQTLALVFDETGRGEEEQSPFQNYTTQEHTLYNPTGKDRFTRDFLAKIVGGISTTENNTEWKEKKLEEIRKNYVQRHIPLLVSITTRDFDKAKESEEEYREAGLEQASAYLKIHTGELIHRTFDDLENLLDYLPDSAKGRIPHDWPQI